MLRVARLAFLVMVLFSSGCAEPPSKEMNQAQGAIDAARAAGADRFAAEEFQAAVDALKRSDEAVGARDYRQALNHAIDSRERAQNAAKLAVEGRANSRGEAERAIAEVATLHARAETLLKNPALARAPAAAALRVPQATVETAGKALQEARSALKKEDYAQVGEALGSISTQLQAALTMIEQASPPAPVRRKQ
ncbi:MAG: hypothetical protein ABI665_18260 [Vicinamibacterales bacterium]